MAFCTFCFCNEKFCKDVTRIFEAGDTELDFGIYEASKINIEGEVVGKEYYIFVEKYDSGEDEFPIIISEETAKEIMKNRDRGLEFVRKYWKERQE